MNVKGVTVKQSLYVRGVHRYSFRSMEWALARGVILATPDGAQPRPCLEVLFDDGVEDLWPVFTEPQHYEFGSYLDSITKTDKEAKQ